jgi:broad specificity phosphatase PhoE
MIYIIRHGQTELNSRQVLQGRSDYPLNDSGIEQAAEAGEKLRGIAFASVYSSPLLRAVQTAEIVAPGVKPKLDSRLIEMDYGPYEGMSLKDPDPEIRRFFSDFVHQPAPEGMEALADVTARLGVFLEELKNSGVNGNIMISTHAIAMKGALEYLTPASAGSYWSKYIGNCAVYTAGVREDGTYSVPEEFCI